MDPWVLHVDLDQFLVAVELLRHPELRGRPVVVGGVGDPTKRGVVSTASYEARAFGVFSGTPLRTAARKCPDAVFLPVDKPVYEAASEEVMAVLRSLGVVVEVLGWDEAFLAADTPDPEAFAHRIRAEVRARTSLDCSVGIGLNKLQAKLATGFAKPGGVFRITDDTWMPILGDRPTEALWGIGRKTSKRLAELGITTVQQLATADPDRLAATFGPGTGPWLVAIARGRGGSTVTDTPPMPRSRGREVTFQHNLTNWADVRRKVVALTHKVTDDVAGEDRPVARVVVKIRYAPFFTESHSRTVSPPSREPAALEAAALSALERFRTDRAVRLVGVRAEFTDPAADQPSSG